jgi:3',5'-nucleoside bisphosphate phosphatase
MIYDLHSHTLASDGALSPAELIAAAEQAGVDALAITDHDTVAGYSEWRALNKPSSVLVIPGIEFSTTWNGIGVHIVGLNINPASDAISSGSEMQLAARRERTSQIVERLRKAGLAVEEKALLEYAGTTAPGRPHIARYLVQQQLVKDESTAFKKYLGAGKAGDVKNLWANLATIIDWIRASGGTAVLAHPDKYQLTFSKLTRLSAEFAGLGGQAIEVISGQQLAATTERLARLAVAQGLLASVGSDFHQPGQPWAGLGRTGELPRGAAPVWDTWETRA